jgi:hypothetical protein
VPAVALTELTAHAATDLAAEPRAMLLAADDYSAVSGKVPLSNMYERGRSLGIGVQVSADSGRWRVYFDYDYECSGLPAG